MAQEAPGAAFPGDPQDLAAFPRSFTLLGEVSGTIFPVIHERWESTRWNSAGFIALIPIKRWHSRGLGYGILIPWLLQDGLASLRAFPSDLNPTAAFPTNARCSLEVSQARLDQPGIGKGVPALPGNVALDGLFQPKPFRGFPDRGDLLGSGWSRAARRVFFFGKQIHDPDILSRRSGTGSSVITDMSLSLPSLSSFTEPSWLLVLQHPRAEHSLLL